MKDKFTLNVFPQSHPEVVAAGQDALAKYGAGLSSVRFICGTQDIHKVILNLEIISPNSVLR